MFEPYPSCHHRFAGVLLSLLATLCSVSAQVITTELLTNPGAESLLDGWQVVHEAGFTQPAVDSGTYIPGLSPRTGSYQFVGDQFPAGGGTRGYLTQLVDLTGQPGSVLAQIDAGAVQARVSFWERSYYQGLPDYARVELSYLDAGSNVLGGVSTADIASTSPTGTPPWFNLQEDLAVPAGTRYISYTMGFLRGANGGTYVDAYIDDNSLMLVVPEPVATGVGFAGILIGFAAWRHAARRAKR